MKDSKKPGSNRLLLIGAVVVAILVVSAVPVWAMAEPRSKVLEEIVEELGFADIGAFLNFFGLDENGKGDYADSSGSIDADVLAKELGFADGDALARALGLNNEEELEELLEESDGDLRKLAQALGYPNANQLARDLGLGSRAELAAALDSAAEVKEEDSASSEEDSASSEEDSASNEEEENSASNEEEEDSADTGGKFTASLNQEFEQESESGDVSISARVSSSGDNSNQTAPVSQAANTGNLQNAQGVIQQGSEGEDIEFEGSSMEMSPEQAVQSRQEVQQSSAASSEE